MLALTITPAYKKNGEIVLDKAQYERNTRVMRQHLANGMLVEEYSAQKKREVLQTHQNPNKCGVLRGSLTKRINSSGPRSPRRTRSSAAISGTWIRSRKSSC